MYSDGVLCSYVEININAVVIYQGLSSYGETYVPAVVIYFRYFCKGETTILGNITQKWVA